MRGPAFLRKPVSPAVAEAKLRAAEDHLRLEDAWALFCDHFPRRERCPQALVRHLHGPRGAVFCRSRPLSEGWMMSRAMLIIHGDASRQKAMHWASRAPLGTRVEFKDVQRTLPQNDRMWAMLTDVASQVLWAGKRRTPDTWKLLFLRLPPPRAGAGDGISSRARRQRRPGQHRNVLIGSEQGRDDHAHRVGVSSSAPSMA